MHLSPKFNGFTLRHLISLVLTSEKEAESTLWWRLEEGIRTFLPSRGVIGI